MGTSSLVPTPNLPVPLVSCPTTNRAPRTLRVFMLPLKTSGLVSCLTTPYHPSTAHFLHPPSHPTSSHQANGHSSSLSLFQGNIPNLGVKPRSLALQANSLPAEPQGKPRLLLKPQGNSGEGNGTPLQYSCLERYIDRGAWWATIQGFRVGHD